MLHRVVIAIERRVPDARRLWQANLFELHGHSEFWGHAIEVTYSFTTITGQPHLSYRDRNVIYSFTGDEIRILDMINPEDLGQ